jgi:hypothetical protein
MTKRPCFPGFLRRWRLRSVSQCDASRSRLKLWNESGTNHARIADSDQLRFRSPQHLALTPHRGTRSSLARLDKLRFGGEILKAFENVESNQKSVGVNRIPSSRSYQLVTRHARQKREARLRTGCPGHPRLKPTTKKGVDARDTGERKRRRPSVAYVPAMTEICDHCVLATRGGDA